MSWTVYFHDDYSMIFPFYILTCRWRNNRFWAALLLCGWRQWIHWCVCSDHWTTSWGSPGLWCNSGLQLHTRSSSKYVNVHVCKWNRKSLKYINVCAVCCVCCVSVAVCVVLNIGHWSMQMLHDGNDKRCLAWWKDYDVLLLCQPKDLTTCPWAHKLYLQLEQWTWTESVLLFKYLRMIILRITILFKCKLLQLHPPLHLAPALLFQSQFKTTMVSCVLRYPIMWCSIT